MIRLKFNEEPNYDTVGWPMVILRTYNWFQHFDISIPPISLRVGDYPHHETLNVVTQDQSKIVLKISSEPKKVSYSKKMASLSLSNYNLMSQLQ